MKRLNLPQEKTFVGPALIWKRIIAFFIDILIINLIVLFPFRSLFEGIIPKEHSFSEAYRLLSSIRFKGFISSVSIAISILIILYFFMLERKMGQTIGKRLMNIYVASDNNSLKSWQLFVRNIIFIPIFPLVLLWILDPLSMFLTKTNQRLSEILSRTKVVEKFSISD